MRKQGIYARYIKRLLDIICSLAALILFCWLYAIIAILVYVKLGSPVLFTQERPGKDEKIFKIYKFRTMTDARDENGELLLDAERLTKFGKALRATSMDELPEVFNILKGDMSIIGPRPLLVKYLPLYNDFQHKRHEIKPGLTGYAQVYGRNALTWEEKFEKDVYYAENVSLKLDLKILLKTIAVVFTREGINQEGSSSATTEPFRGTQLEREGEAK